jgi:hypothetical protein
MGSRKTGRRRDGFKGKKATKPRGKGAREVMPPAAITRDDGIEVQSVRREDRFVF